MASTNSLSSRLEELRSRNPQSPPKEHTYSGYNTPSRYSGSFMPSHSQPSNETRASLQRRFTTDLSSLNMPMLAPIGQQPQPAPTIDSIDMSSTTFHKVQLLEKKRLEYELLREQRKRFEAELEKFNLQQAREKQELDKMAQDLRGINLVAGYQSEPTTPPEYRDHVFSSGFPRPNRFSSSSLVSPPGLINRSSRSGSQLTSPPSEPILVSQNHGKTDKLPSKSVPGSRRGSNDKIIVYMPDNTTAEQRSTIGSNRYSMPVTGLKARDRDNGAEYSSALGLGHINTTGFLFGDDDETAKKESATSPDVSSYLQMNATDDKFPILVRRDDYPGLLSASSAALDLALSQSPGPDSQTNGWTPFARHRPSQQSLPQNVFQSPQNNPHSDGPSNNGFQHTRDIVDETPITARQLQRRSMEATLASLAQNIVPGHAIQTAIAPTRPTLANMQSSYSTNDIPTTKTNYGHVPTITPPKTHAQQHFHNHNASLGRIPPNAMNNRHSRELPGGDARREEQTNGYQAFQSGLQASAAPFGPSPTMPASVETIPTAVSPSTMSPYGNPSYYGGYGVQLMNMGMNPMNMANPMAFNSHMQAYQQQGHFAAYQQYGNPGRFHDSQARIMQQRRAQNGEENARFTNVKLEHLQGEIYALCKDQHGCRYLQKKLEERNPEHIHLIFTETNQHVVELMTDPFGNYLCQKLLEYSSEQQRTVLINNASPQMVKIALNQHGTRALQKMIEFITTPEQTQIIIYALQDRVVELIQDLNGNHVIQKCLNRLTPKDAQFIFDAVGNNCVVVGTHRHGCCVLQRCIDHASGHQKAQLISQITADAFALVQDPFGNYVLQYIVDLAEPAFTDPLCYIFQGSISSLSKQKFSSNVIEKCLRGADTNVTRVMIEEMLNANELEKMLRDSFANYVVQTALDYADPETKTRLTDAIRPILPAIRQTPYGRRIQSKIMGADGQGRLSGMSTPNDTSSPGQIALGRHNSVTSSTNPHPAATTNGLSTIIGSYANTHPVNYQVNGVMTTTPFMPSTMAPTSAHPQNLSNGSSNFSQFSGGNSQNSVHHNVQNYGRVPQAEGFNYF